MIQRHRFRQAHHESGTEGSTCKQCNWTYRAHVRAYTQQAGYEHCHAGNHAGQCVTHQHCPADSNTGYAEDGAQSRHPFTHILTAGPAAHRRTSLEMLSVQSMGCSCLAVCTPPCTCLLSAPLQPHQAAAPPIILRPEAKRARNQPGPGRWGPCSCEACVILSRNPEDTARTSAVGARSHACKARAHVACTRSRMRPHPTSGCPRPQQQPLLQLCASHKVKGQQMREVVRMR